MRPGPVHLLGRGERQGLLARRDRQGSPRSLVAGQQKSRKDPFFIWWAPAAPHREDVADDADGPPGPRPAARRRATPQKSKGFTLPRPPSFNEADFSDKPSNMREHGAAADRRRRSHQLQLDYEGRIGVAAGGRRPRQAARRDPAQDRPARQHADRLRLRQRLAAGRAPHPGRQVPALRGVAARPVHPARARRARRPDGRAARSPTSTSPRRCSTSPARKAGRTHGRRLAAADCCATRGGARAASLEIEAPRRCSRATSPVNAWDRPYKGVRTDRYTYVVYTETRRRRSSTTAADDPDELRNVAADPAYAQVKAKPRRPSWPGSTGCKGALVRVRRAMRGGARRACRRGSPRRRPPRERPPTAA